MNFQFKKYRDDDNTEIKKLITDLYREDSCGEPMTEDKINKTLHELESRPDKGSVWIFIYKNRIVGYSILINYWSNEHGGNILAIDEIYVKPSFRNRGIGSAFIRFIISNSDVSVKLLTLEVTPENNKAFKYYKNKGFTLSGNRHMIKKL